MRKAEKNETLSFKLSIKWDILKGDRRIHDDEFGSNSDYFQIVKSVVKESTEELRGIINKYSNNSIEVIRMDSFYSGSFIAFLTFVFNAAVTLKDIYEIREMIKDICETFLKSRLKEEFSRLEFYVRLDELDGYKISRYKTGEFYNKSDSRCKFNRDGFFYFLLLYALMETVIIGFLVFKAVMKIYFT